MKRRRWMLFAAALIAVAAAASVTLPAAGDSQSQSTFGTNFFSVRPPRPVKEFPTLESIAPLPMIIDPLDRGLVPVSCQIQVEREQSRVRRRRGTYTAQLIVIDFESGTFDTFDIDNGRFRTNSDGIGEFGFEIPSEIFAEGFESGDVSAWSYTRADFTNAKEASSGALVCWTTARREGRQDTFYAVPQAPERRGEMPAARHDRSMAGSRLLSASHHVREEDVSEGIGVPPSASLIPEFDSISRALPKGAS